MAWETEKEYRARMAGIDPAAPPLTDLGWANGWKEVPALVAKCRAAEHECRSVDVGPANRGLENVVKCLKCRIIWRYDSSD